MFLTKIFGQIKEVQQLREVDQVIKSIPPDTKFVTIITAIPVADPSSLKERVMPSSKNATIGYLSHNGVSLTLSNETGIIFSVPLSQIVNVTPFVVQGNYFFITLQTGGWYLGQAVGVKRDEHTGYRTFDSASGPTDASGGWLREFSNFGVASQN